MIKKILKKLRFYKEKLYPLEIQAKKAGVKIGVNNAIHSHFWSSEPYLISIGSNCAITYGVKIFTHGGARVARGIQPKFDIFGKVVIGDNTYIGTNSLIMPGVTIGNNVLVAAGSVVTHSVPDNVVIGGNPARILCTVAEYYQRNLPYNTNTKGLNFEEKKKVLSALPDEMFVRKKMMKSKL